jgi:hypothetical protein
MLQPTAVLIGERRKAQLQGQPGFLRLDAVHQDDQPDGGEKSVYHINAVNEVTQWEVRGLARAMINPQPSSPRKPRSVRGCVWDGRLRLPFRC